MLEISFEKRPQIQSFQDYRSYLKKLYEFKKAENPKISFQYLAQKLALDKSYFQHVIEKRRHISIDTIPKLSAFFQFTALEEDYFSFMVLRELSKSEQMQNRFGTILGSLDFVMDAKEQKDITFSIRDEAGEYVSGNWLASVILEMTALPDFSDEPAKIRARLIDEEKVSEEEIRECLQKLLAYGLLAQEEGRYFKPKPTEFLANPFSRNQSFEVYREGVRKTYSVLEEPRKYNSCNFFMGAYPFDAETEQEAIQEFHRYRDRIVQISQKSKNPDRILFFSNNQFNLLKKKEN